MKLSDMKIVAGLGSLDAFDAYVDAGADESVRVLEQAGAEIYWKTS